MEPTETVRMDSAPIQFIKNYGVLIRSHVRAVHESRLSVMNSLRLHEVLFNDIDTLHTTVSDTVVVICDVMIRRLFGVRNLERRWYMGTCVTGRRARAENERPA